MENNTHKALKWIVSVLHGAQIPYRIGGGMAMAIYGSNRPVNDIDISLSGKYFSELVPLVKEYIVAGPKHYQNEKWDCVTLSLNYQGQDIDLTDVDTLRMSNKEGTEWIKSKLLYEAHPDIAKSTADFEVVLMHPRVLVSYKKELGGEHQLQDILFLEKYIEVHKL